MIRKCEIIAQCNYFFFLSPLWFTIKNILLLLHLLILINGICLGLKFMHSSNSLLYLILICRRIGTFLASMLQWALQGFTNFPGKYGMLEHINMTYFNSFILIEGYGHETPLILEGVGNKFLVLCNCNHLEIKGGEKGKMKGLEC